MQDPRHFDSDYFLTSEEVDVFKDEVCRAPHNSDSKVCAPSTYNNVSVTSNPPRTTRMHYGCRISMNPEITYLNPEIWLMGLKVLRLALIDGKVVQQNMRNGHWMSTI